MELATEQAWLPVLSQTITIKQDKLCVCAWEAHPYLLEASLFVGSNPVYPELLSTGQTKAVLVTEDQTARERKFSF